MGIVSEDSAQVEGNGYCDFAGISSDTLVTQAGTCFASFGQIFVSKKHRYRVKPGV